jgi:hypothetical protein
VGGKDKGKGREVLEGGELNDGEVLGMGVGGLRTMSSAQWGRLTVPATPASPPTSNQDQAQDITNIVTTIEKEREQTRRKTRRNGTGTELRRKKKRRPDSPMPMQRTSLSSRLKFAKEGDGRVEVERPGSPLPPDILGQQGHHVLFGLDGEERGRTNDLVTERETEQGVGVIQFGRMQRKGGRRNASPLPIPFRRASSSVRWVDKMIRTNETQGDGEGDGGEGLEEEVMLAQRLLRRLDDGRQDDDD